MEQNTLKIYGDGGIALKNNDRKLSLKKELFLLSAASCCAALLFYMALSWISVQLIQRYYNTESHIRQVEETYAEKLQNYITEYGISSKELDILDKWVMEQDNLFLKLFQNGSLIYDTMYGITEYTENSGERAEQYPDMKRYSLSLQDTEMEALLFCYDFRAEDRVNHVLLSLSFALFFVLLILGVRKKAVYLTSLNRELKKLSDNLENPIPVQGRDEIAEVAKGIDMLRLAVIEKLNSEKRAYDANMKLVTSLSHDIKTPLTSIIAYIELAHEKAGRDGELKKYLNISLEKSVHLKNMVNELFEHFLLHSNEYEVSFECVSGNELIVQMLEENLYDLEMKGVPVKREASDIASTLNVNVHLVYRLFENLFSNIYKYADLTKEIIVRYYLKDGYLTVSLENEKLQNASKKFSTNIGLNNCRAIMEKHQGKMEIIDTEHRMNIMLYFPL